MAIVDFEKEFSEFVNTGASSSITDIYKIIPTLTNDQIQVVLALRYFINKYDLKPVEGFLYDYMKNMKTNKNLGFLNNMQLKQLLKSYTQEELIRGIKIQSTTNKED